MLKLALVLSAILILSSCQQTRDDVSSKQKWRGSTIGAIGGVAAYYLLDCRSLKTEAEHHYFSVYMPRPTKNDYFEFKNEEGHSITSIPNTEFWSEKVTTDGVTSNNKGIYSVKVDFQITQINHRHYRYEVIANAETLAYFAEKGTDETRRILRDEAFIVVDYDGTNYRVLKHPRSVFVKDETFNCRKAQQGQLVD
jgi:hypothetical protein